MTDGSSKTGSMLFTAEPSYGIDFTSESRYITFRTSTLVALLLLETGGVILTESGDSIALEQQAA